MNARAPISRKIHFQLHYSALLLLAAGLLVSGQDGAAPSEMAELARRYQHGIGCPRDLGRALLYYRRAADHGDPHAMVALGDLYHEGVCVDRDVPYAMGMYKRAAEAGLAPAMMRLGDARNDQQWYRKAADLGYGPAMTRLGDLLGDAEWYRKAVAAQDPPAFAKLAATVPDPLPLLERGAELRDPAAMSALALRLEKDDPRRAAKLFHDAAEGGDPVAMERWAHFSEHGLAGVRQSIGEAAVWYRKAADRGNPAALFWMGVRASDPAVAKIFLGRAAKAGHPAAMREMAVREGSDGLLRAAAESGDAQAMLRLGWVERAADAGNVEALAQLGRLEEAAGKGHAPSLFKLGRIEEAARLGHPEALFAYGLSLPDKAEGTRWVQRAAEAGHSEAMRELGLRYREGSGAPVDAELSAVWLRRAAEAGDAQALFETGKVRESADLGYGPAMVRMGEDTGDRTWFERAAATGFANAWTKLGELGKAAAAGDPEAKMLLASRSRNAREAYRLYVEAAEAGYAPAMLRAGDCHMEGRGASQSEIDAVNWYRRAARAGSPEAFAKLEKLGKSL